MVQSLRLKIAIANYPHTAPILDGRIPIRGVLPEFVKVDPIIAAFRRMVRNLEFDICEMAPTTYLVARAYGSPFTALPIFFMRRFHHGGLMCREDANIRTPKDLEGKKVGVRAYTVTTGVWTRGILMNEYGLDSSKVTWVVDDEEHVTGLPLPSNVVHAPDGKSLVSLMEAGEIQAGFGARAGIGREGAPKSGWEEIRKPAPQNYHDLFADAGELEAAWFRRTGIYPMHGHLVVKNEVLRANPWLPKALFDAFSAAKAPYLKRLASGEANGPEDNRYRKLTELVGADPLPYGFRANRISIQAMIDYAHQQGLIPKRVAPEEVFIDPEA